MLKNPPFLFVFISFLLIQILAAELIGLHRYAAAPAAAMLLWLIYKNCELNRNDVGIQSVSRKAVVWSALIFGSILLLFCLVYLVLPSTLMDERYNQSLGKTLVSAFIILPLTTVLLEEFAFRGVLLGKLVKAWSEQQALLVSSLLFGLWHITSSFDVRVDSFLFISNPPQILISLTIVLVTSAAGYIFSIMRLKTGSLLVPIAAHWSLNAFGMIFAWLAWQQ